MEWLELPQYVALKSKGDNKYLKCIEEKFDAGFYANLRLSGEEVATPYTKFEVEPSESDGRQLVHIRSCYNNKYWVPLSEGEEGWIGAHAQERDERLSSPSCTLFQPLHSGGGETLTITFHHVRRNGYAPLRRRREAAAAPRPFDSWGLCAPATTTPSSSSSSSDDDDVCSFEMIDWGRLLVLPKRVSLHLKDHAGSYLSATTSTIDGRVEFTPANGDDDDDDDVDDDDDDDPRAVHEVFNTRDGGIRIRSIQFGKFWRRNSKNNRIFADSDDSTGDDDPNTLFWPFKIRDDIIAIRNLGNNKFCQTEVGRIYPCLGIFKPSFFFLASSQSSITRDARFVVREPFVVSRKISDVEFHLTRARIYNLSTLNISPAGLSKAISNATSTPSQHMISQSMTVTERYSTWNRTVSSLGGMKKRLITIRSRIPSINHERQVVELSSHDLFTRAFAWGETESMETMKVIQSELTVPPMTTTEMKVTATQCSCDVPFSYTCYDTLCNGEILGYQMDDGVYTGVHCYNFKFELVRNK